LITVLGAINVGTFYFFFGAFGPTFGIEDTLTHRVLFVAAITALQALVNHYGIGLTMKLTDFSGYVILIGSVALAAISLCNTPSWDFSRLWTFHDYTGTATYAADGTLTGSPVWPNTVGIAMAFILGLLLPVYTITGYDASAHTAEETVNAQMAVPKGMVSS